MSREDVIILKPTTQEFPDEQIGRMTSEPMQNQEVSGREMVVRIARCGQCGATGYINYDTVNYRAYKCNNCHTCVGGHGH